VIVDKLCARGQLAARVAALAAPVVFTNGVFDILHRGHVSYLEQARALGASLVIGLNSDASARGLGKGPQRPLNGEADRACVLAALESGRRLRHRGARGNALGAQLGRRGEGTAVRRRLFDHRAGEAHPGLTSPTPSGGGGAVLEARRESRILAA